MGTDILQVEGLSFSLGDKRILKDLTFAIPTGSMVGVLGPNGSGKTTLLRLLCRYWQAEHGRVLLAGRDDYSLQELSRLMAYLPQNLPEGLPMPVEDFLLLGLYPTLQKRTLLAEHYQQLETIISQFDLKKIRHSRVGDLSSGEERRVFIASGLMHRPKIYLLDEPNNGLDWKYHAAIFARLRTYQQEQGMTLVMTLHDLNLAWNLCEWILLLHPGGGCHFGPAREVLTVENLSLVYGVPFERVESRDGQKQFFVH